MMRSILVIVYVLGFQISYDARAQEVNVVIENIISDGSISGYVEGMDAGTMLHYRVVVYVHTDIWYIHPYGGQGEGLSWAAIRPDGIHLLNLVGEMMLTCEGNQVGLNRQVLEISAIPSGVYFIELVIGNERSFGKVIIQR